ncbi:hypothetical protein RFI_29712 [Reticulomyxa filosa]|uniref:CAP-Gly domain-containing protein n=1 Tax=Reticulomyxa filosa TaxID=46433 RepID=X6M0G4_RETFI|nr:hypothetical protein RFI_29712 [Reticulomyxa filosa]|eukprot:ETO07678.1 hypothetical protein RFI_29712 [Reticulomyxa filosa]
MGWRTDFSRGEKRDPNSIIDGSIIMVEEILQVHDNIKKESTFVLTYLLNTREKQHEEDTWLANRSNDEISLSAIAFLISSEEQEGEEEAEMNKDEDENEDDKAEHGRVKSKVMNCVDVDVGDRAVSCAILQCDFPMEKIIGIELDSRHPNATDGTVRGKIYFKVSFNLFILFLMLESKLRATMITISMAKTRQQHLRKRHNRKTQFKIRDYVKLFRGKVKVSKYIGETDLIELELDT